MRRASGYADGLISGATWGVVAILLPGSALLTGESILAMPLAVAAVFDAAAAFFLLARSTAAGALLDVLRLAASRRAVPIAFCSLLGGPLFMGGYVAAVIMAGPSDALTATATYPVGGYSYAIWYRSISKIGVARAMALNISPCGAHCWGGSSAMFR